MGDKKTVLMLFGCHEQLFSYAEGPLLLTLGCAWLSSPLASALPVECAVLHRVVAPPRDRHSIPFLVDLKTA